jgi:hypothetical protein
MDRELDFFQVVEGKVDRNLLFAKYHLEYEVDNFGANLILKRLRARESKITDLIVFWLTNLLILWKSHDVTLEIAGHSAVFDASSVVVSHFVINVNAIWNADIVSWKDVN